MAAANTVVDKIPMLLFENPQNLTRLKTSSFYLADTEVKK